MNFKLNKPVNIGLMDKADSTVSEAIATLYRKDEGWMFTFHWNGIELLFDGVMIANIYNDISKMLIAIAKEEPKFSISFLDTGFTAIWHIEMNVEEITIDARWTSITSKDDDALEKLREFNVLTVEKSEFSAPWEFLLKHIKIDLLNAGYTDRLKGFEYLDKLK